MPSNKKNGWKQTQSRIKKSKRTKLALTVLILLLLLILLSQIGRLSKTLFSPWKLTTKSSRLTNWNGEFNLNLLVGSKSVSLISLNPKEKKVVIINIPDETYLEVPHGFGKWQLRSIFELGQSQNGGNGNRLLKDTLSGLLALPIDGFLDFAPPFDQMRAHQLVELLKNNPFSGFTLLSRLKSDLTLWELLRLKISLSSVRFDKITELDLAKLSVLDKTSLPDGSQVFTGDPVKLDSVLSDLADSNFVSEQKSIALFNATDHPQLAQKAARLISNLGGHVIITSNAKARLKKTAVYGEQSASLKRLRQIFDAGDTIDGSNEDLVSSRAQINIFLGEDYFMKF